MAKASVPAKAQSQGGVPDYLKGHVVDQRDNFDQSDIVIPRVKLLQGLSKECEAFDTAKPGRFWHTGMDLDLGPELRFIVASRKKKYLLVAPIADGQGILARAENFTTWNRLGKWDVKLKDVKKPVEWSIDDLNVAKSGLDQWGTSNPADEDSPPAATLFYEYLVILPDHLDLGPAVVSLARSQIRKAKKGLNDKIELHKSAGRPMQALVFKAVSVDDSADGQAFKNWQFTGDGFAPEELFKQAIDMKDAMTNYAVQGEEEVASETEGKTRSARSNTPRKDGEPEEF